MALVESGPVSGENPFGDGPLVRRVSKLVGHINAANAALVSLLGEVLATEAWAGAGVRSPEHWVTWRCGVSPGHARRLVAAARALSELPETAGVFAVGEIGEDQVGEIVRSGVDRLRTRRPRSWRGSRRCRSCGGCCRACPARRRSRIPPMRSRRRRSRRRSGG